jgi:hypothetical protein
MYLPARGQGRQRRVSSSHGKNWRFWPESKSSCSKASSGYVTPSAPSSPLLPSHNIQTRALTQSASCDGFLLSSRCDDPNAAQIATSEGHDQMADRNSSEYQLFNLRLPVHVLERIQRYRDFLNESQPGIDANVSMAARMLLMRALDQVEKEMRPGEERRADRNAQNRKR